MSNEALSNLEVQLQLTAIYLELESLRKRLERERTDPESGPMFAHLRFAERSIKSAADTHNPVLVRVREPRPEPVQMPERKRWSLFGS